jgi:hypothetical protein
MPLQPKITVKALNHTYALLELFALDSDRFVCDQPTNYFVNSKGQVAVLENGRIKFWDPTSGFRTISIPDRKIYSQIALTDSGVLIFASNPVNYETTECLRESSLIHAFSTQTGLLTYEINGALMQDIQVAENRRKQFVNQQKPVLENRITALDLQINREPSNHLLKQERERLRQCLASLQTDICEQQEITFTPELVRPDGSVIFTAYYYAEFENGSWSYTGMGKYLGSNANITRLSDPLSVKPMLMAGIKKTSCDVPEIEEVVQETDQYEKGLFLNYNICRKTTKNGAFLLSLQGRRKFMDKDGQMHDLPPGAVFFGTTTLQQKDRVVDIAYGLSHDARPVIFMPPDNQLVYLANEVVDPIEDAYSVFDTHRDYLLSSRLELISGAGEFEFAIPWQGTRHSYWINDFELSQIIFTSQYTGSLKAISEDNGLILAIRTKVNNTDGTPLPPDQRTHTAALLVPVEVVSIDRVLRGGFEIPEGWTNVALSFKNKTTGQNLGTYENLEPGAQTDVKIYDSPDDFFSDEEMEQNRNGKLPDNAKNQDVTFARDPENPRKIEFGMVFDDVGEVEIKLTFGPDRTEAILTHMLRADAVMADFITTMNERIASIEVPGSDELPIDTDGDGVPDGSGVNDLLQAHQPGSIALPGALLHEDLEENPLNLVLRINDDDDDGNGQPDNGDTVIHAADNDVSRLLLKRPGNLAANVGTLTLTVTGGNAVRLFNSAGSALLANYTVDLANPTGDLAGLAAGSVPVYVEGLADSAEVILTLTYRDARNMVVSSDSVHLSVAGSARFAILQMMNGMVAVGTTQIKWRTYAANGAATWETLGLVPIGQNPPLQNRGMLSKVFWEITKRSVQSQLAWTKGFMDGFWVALKGEIDTVVSVWTFFRDDPFGRSAAMFGAVKQAIGELKQVPASEIPGLLATISKNLWENLYTQAENALPWAPVDPPPALVLKYMEGFAAGTITEGVAVSLLGVGVATKTATAIKGIIAAAKTGRYALDSLNALRKATAKTTHILLRLAKSEKASIHIGAIGKRLEKIELPSGKKATEVFDEAFRDKPELLEKVLKNWDQAWPDISDETRRATRYQKCAHSLAELKDIMGGSLSDDALEGFSMFQRKLFTETVDDSDRFNDFVALWRGLDTPAKKQSLNESLAAYKTDATIDPDAKFWIKDLDAVQTKGYRYVTQDELNLINGNGGILPVHNGKGWYCSLEDYASVADAKSALQLPSQTYVARIEFNLSDVKNNIRMPFDNIDGDKTIFEPVARAFPNNGSGGGTQFLVDGTSIPVTIHLF